MYIELTNVSKKIKGVTVLDNVSLRMESGSRPTSDNVCLILSSSILSLIDAKVFKFSNPV